MNTLTRLLGFTAVLAGIALASWLVWNGSSPARPRNVILITLDTTRADALGAYGRKGIATPVLDRMAAEGHVFEQAYAHAPITLPSHSSMLTGLTPPRHGVRNNIAYRLAADQLTLPEMLKARGFATSAFVSSMILDSRFGLDQGFDVYDDDIVHYTEKTAKAIVTRRAGSTFDSALAWLAAQRKTQSDQPFFSWIHLYDAHYPYDPPLPYKQAYADSPYHGEIAYMDQQIGRLVRFLKDADLYDDTLIIVTADHGESFGEHGEQTHGYFCYGATTHVPLILSQPLYGVPGQRYAHQVQSVDMLPSILQALGLEAATGLDGLLLSSDAARSVFSEAIIPSEDFYLAPVHSLKDEQYTFYYSSDLELYDRKADPGETNNLVKQQPDLAALYRDRVQLVLDSSTQTGAKASIDQATIEMLRSLGYVADGGSAVASGMDPFLLPSPRHSVGIYRRLQALRQFEEEYPFKLIEGLQAMLGEDPDQILLHRDLGRLLVLAGDEDGIDHLQRAAALQPADPRLHTFLGLGYHQFGRFEDSIGEYQLALELNPEHLIARYNLGLAQLALGQVDAAERSFETVVEQNDKDILALNNLAYIAYRHRGDSGRALALIEQARRINPEHPLLRENAKRFAEPSGG
jgi:choline-sulfatase